MRRFKNPRYLNAFEVTTHPEALGEPLVRSVPSVYAVCTTSDLFHEKVPFEFIDKVMEVITYCPSHTFQILTKRVERMGEYFAGYYETHDLLENAWLGTTVEDRDCIWRIDVLSGIPAKVRFLACIPLLSDIGKINLDNIDWVIAGGESGRRARRMEKEWVVSLRDHCQKSSVRFFFKQWGMYSETGKKQHAKRRSHTIDGVEYWEFPVEYIEKEGEWKKK